MENYLLSEIERRYSVVRCVRFVVGPWEGRDGVHVLQEAENGK